MQIDDLQIGMKVQIIDFGGSDYDRPEHWSDDMDEWQGALVTIAEIDRSDEYVYLEEDEGCWSWYPWDFEYYDGLSFNNPNVSYRRHRSDVLIKEMRAKWKQQQQEKTNKLST